ncbi:MAG: Ubiquinone/menaquinone biosynthesis C-methyltransferase UbiE [Phycisphaerae bacterium]|nr:Ubiquinone/menaquinone biosynthesis C-methyltransferase UbiE [Phycisphaerae bacterium]
MRPPHPGRARTHARRPSTSWDHVASWYDRLVGDEGSDYQRHVIIPAALRLLNPQPGETFLDLCCGQGVLARALLDSSAKRVVGVDASPKLIDAARARGSDSRLSFIVRDVRRLGDLTSGEFDAAACLMSLHDVDDVDAALRGAAAALRVGGRLVLILMHPCFRVPRQSSWGWDDEKKTQYRRLDRYYSPMEIPISVHPGRTASPVTQYYHRPLSYYLNNLARAGLALSVCEELLTHRVASPGAHSRGENRAAAEFPVFLGLRAERVPAFAPPALARPTSAPANEPLRSDNPPTRPPLRRERSRRRENPRCRG